MNGHQPPAASRHWRQVLMIAVFAGLAAAPSATQVTVKSDVDVKSDKNMMSDPVESVPADTALSVLDRDGGWIHVRTPAGKVGFISEDDLPAKIDMAAVTGSGNATAIDPTLSGKGLDDVGTYAKQRNLSTTGLKLMVANGDAVSAKDLREFAKAGHVGPAKYRN